MVMGQSPGSVADLDISALLAPRERCQDLAGFDGEYADFPDYIIRCTHRIWEQRNVGLIRTHYGEDCRIHTINGDVAGIEPVIHNTLATLAAFPDRTLYGDDVIWDGNARDGFFSSHRITSHMTNRGPGEFGPPTGRHAVIRTIADCEVRNNRIGREWLVRDNLALVWQLGLNPHAVAREQAAADPEAGLRWVETAKRVLDRTERHAEAPAPAAGLLKQALDRIWNHRLIGDVAALYSPAAAVHAPSGREMHGPRAVAGHIVSLLATLPDAVLVMDRFTEIPSGRGGAMVAVRWRLAGRHTRPGLYGAPSGRTLLILGVSHFHAIDGQVHEEWTVFDELGVLRQIHARPGGAA